MKKTKFTDSQIIGILKEQEQGKSVSEICRTQYKKIVAGQTLHITVSKDVVEKKLWGLLKSEN